MGQSDLCGRRDHHRVTRSGQNRSGHPLPKTGNGGRLDSYEGGWRADCRSRANARTGAEVMGIAKTMALSPEAAPPAKHIMATLAG